MGLEDQNALSGGGLFVPDYSNSITAHNGARNEVSDILNGSAVVEAMPIAIQERAISENMDAGPGGKGWSDEGSAYTLEARNNVQAVAYDFFNISAPVNRQNRSPGDPCHTLARDNANQATVMLGNQRIGWRVRRLTPTECEALQGFPRNYTNIPYRNKNDAPDGPRYKALGNSMAVNAMRWIGRRIEMVDALKTTHV